MEDKFIQKLRLTKVQNLSPHIMKQLATMLLISLVIEQYLLGNVKDCVNRIFKALKFPCLLCSIINCDPCFVLLLM